MTKRLSLPVETKRKSEQIGLVDTLDVDALRAKLRVMTDAELNKFGREMRALVYPLTYDGNGMPTVRAFSIQLEEARREYRRRHPKSMARAR